MSFMTFMHITNLDLLPDFMPKCKSVNTSTLPFICSILYNTNIDKRSLRVETSFMLAKLAYLQLIALTATANNKLHWHWWHALVSRIVFLWLRHFADQTLSSEQQACNTDSILHFIDYNFSWVDDSS